MSRKGHYSKWILYVYVLFFRDGELGRALKAGTLGVPDPTPLPYDTEDVSYHMIGDDAFALQETMMKPYPGALLTNEQRIFNYRLSRARRVVENAFGILTMRFRIFLTKILLEPDKVTTLVRAAVVLHNFINKTRPHDVEGDNEDPQTHNTVPGAWRRELQEQQPQRPELLVPLQALPAGFRNPTHKAKHQRDLLCTYYNTVGSVPWQDKAVSLRLLDSK